jgi:hypothetical protein
MNSEDLVKKLIKNKILILPEGTLTEVLKLKNLKILREEETHISGKIRILELNRNLIIQETTLNHELSLRKMKNPKEAKLFIKDRLTTYEKMWDGCGCKVDYYH